ncbi:MAG: class I SAM-dependent methyltransferase [archaeon]
MVKFYKKGEVASKYDEERFTGQGGEIINRREKKNVLDLLGDIEGKKILDLGAGTCRYSVLFSEQGAEVTAMDISQEMLNEGKKKAEERGVEDKINFIKGDALNTGFEDNSFDIVTAMRLFHLVPDPKGLFKEMKRVTNDRVLFDFFNLWSLRMLYNKSLPMKSKLRRKRKMKNLLVRNGFYNIEIKRDFLIPYGAYRFSPKPLPLFFSKLDYIGRKIFFSKRVSSVIYLTGKKS